MEPKRLHWAVVEGAAEAPILVGHDKANPPVHESEPESLTFYRERLSFLIEKYEVAVVGIRYQETHGRHGKLDGICRRSRIEGVLVEGANAVRIPVVPGMMVQLSAALGVKTAKADLERGELRGLDLSSLTPERREAVLAAVAAMATHGERTEQR
ncbi:MAG: hypothetical protein KC766_02750 [Myxococcales bacterium]|nr:hypothetical protein [Myxococcales bacterium]